MSTQAKIRFLVLNRVNQVIRPKDENLPGMSAKELKAAGEIPKQYSPSFINEATARDFAEGLALKYKGQRFYVATILAGVSHGETVWSEAVPVDGLADNATADDMPADGEPNE